MPHMAETNTYSFADFPEDVQLCVLSFLTPTEIANFACTSKRFVSICQSNNNKLWYAICDRRWGSKTQINKWGQGKISYNLLYRILNEWEHLIGFWRRCGQSKKQQQQTPALVFFEWGPSFLLGSRVSPSPNGTYSVTKTSFLWMGITPEGQIVNYVDPEGQHNNRLLFLSLLSGELGLSEVEMDLVRVSVNFIGDTHFSVEENVSYRNWKGEDSSGGEDVISGSPPGSLPETLEMYQYYANRLSPGADKAWRRQRRRGKERNGKRRWETEHFLKIVDSSPTLARPLQGLWKGICDDDMRLEFYLVAYDGTAITCRRVGDLSERLSSCTPVFWTSNPTFIESPFSHEEENLYNSRIHLRPPGDWQYAMMDAKVVSHIMYINSSNDLAIPGLLESSENPWQVEGRVWYYRNGTFGFGFLRENFIVDLRHITQNGCLLDIMELCSD